MNALSIRRALHALFMACALVAMTAASAADRVVVQVTDGDEAKWHLALNNIRNLQRSLGPEADLEVVAFGPSVAFLKAGSPIAARVQEVVDAGGHFAVCKNTMAGMKLAESDMLPTVGFVPSGVVEVLRKQQQGYAYIRP